MPHASSRHEPPTDADEIKEYYYAIFENSVGSDLKRWLTHHNLARDTALHAHIPKDVWAQNVYQEHREIFMDRSRSTIRLVLTVAMEALCELGERFEEIVNNDGKGLGAEELLRAADNTVMNDGDDDATSDLDLHDSTELGTTIVAAGPGQQLVVQEDQVEQGQRVPQPPTPLYAFSSATIDSAVESRDATLELSDSLSGSVARPKRRVSHQDCQSDGASKRRRPSSRSPEPYPASPSSPAGDDEDGELQPVQSPLFLQDIGPEECVFRYPKLPAKRFFVLRCKRGGCSPGCEQAAQWRNTIIFKAWPFQYRRASSHFGGEAHNLHDQDTIFRLHAHEVLDAVEPRNMRPKPRGSRGPKNKDNEGASAQDDGGETMPTIVATAPTIVATVHNRPSADNENEYDINGHNPFGDPRPGDRGNTNGGRPMRPQPVSFIEIEDDADDDYRHHERPARRFAEPPRPKTYPTRMRTDGDATSHTHMGEATDWEEDSSWSEFGSEL